MNPPPSQVALHILMLESPGVPQDQVRAVLQSRFPQSAVQAASDPAEALELLRAGVFDLILFELAAIDEPVVELLHALRDHATQMPVVLILPCELAPELKHQFSDLPFAWEIVHLKSFTSELLERSLLKAIRNQQAEWELKHLRQAFQSSLVQYRNLFDEVPDLIFMCDRSGCLLEVNATAVRLFHQPKESLLMRPIFDAFGMRGEDFQTLLDRALSHEGPIEDSEIQFQPPGHDPIYGLAHLLRWRQEPSRPLQFQGVIKDISPHKRLEQELRASEDKYKTLYELASISSSSLKLAEVVGHASELIHQCCHCKATLLLMNRSFEELNLVAHVGLSAQQQAALEKQPPIIGQDLLGRLAITSPMHTVSLPNEPELHPVLMELLAENPGYVLQIVALGRGNPVLPTSLLLLLAPTQDCEQELVLIKGLTKTLEMGITNCFHYANSQETETRYRELWDHAPAYFISILKGGIVFEVNHTAANALGYPLQELIGQPLANILDPSDHELFAIHHRLILDTGEPQAYELSLRNRRGERIVVSVKSEPLTDRNGVIVGEKAVLHDVTLGKQLEDQLRDYAENLERKVSERTLELTQTMHFLNGILEGSTEYAIMGLDQQGRFSHFNRGAQLLFGYDNHRVVGREGLDLVIDFEHAPWANQRELLETVGRQGVVVQEVALATADGRNLTGLLTINHLGMPSINELTYVAIMRDITEQKELEELLKLYTENLQQVIEQKSRELDRQHIQLIQSSKLATLGEMAAGIAHELNQPLSGIRTRAQLVTKALERDMLNIDRIKNNQEEIIQLVDRITRIINHMRIFARQDQQRFSPFNLSQSIDGALSLLGEQLRIHGIRIQTKVPTELPFVLGEPLQIEQVILNLVGNARDAVDSKAEQLRHEQGPEGAGGFVKNIEINLYPASESEICFEVRDNGMGMNEETQQKIFEPFFTTKPVGRGTGLGLSISYGILTNHNGRCEVESKPGVGSLFRVYLPIWTGADEQAAIIPAEAKAEEA